jgi:hypothetical protein
LPDVSALLNSWPLTADGRASRLAFSPHVAMDGSTVFMRRLSLDGKDAFEIGNSCDTCPFFFERLEGATETLSPGAAVSAALRDGIEQLEPELLELLGAVVPRGEYRACLLELEPTLVWPGGEADYFSHEQLGQFGIDHFWGLPHYPRTPYYRVSDIPMAPDGRLFEFVVPIVPPRWLDAETVAEYRNNAGAGTALAVGILDVKAPADWESAGVGPYVPGQVIESEVNRHWCLAHYLLDGHHKTYAAANEGRPMRLLSLMAAGEGVSTDEEFERALAALHARER